MIKAEVVADSSNEFGNRITTMVVTFPRIILAEFNTHRMFSRNSASSRAIPFEKMVKSVEENPFIPIAWQKDHKGMQGNSYLNERESKLAEDRWRIAAQFAAHEAKILHGDSKWSINDTEMPNLDVTKQLCNRLLEPFMYHTVIVTATEWENFFALRCPQYVLYGEREGATTYPFRSKKDTVKAMPDLLDIGIKARPMTELDWLTLNKGQAEIHMMALAEAMWDAYNESIPNELKAGEWHIPYNKKCTDLLIPEEGNLYPSDLYQHEVEGTHNDTYTTSLKIKMANMMAARTSYTVFGEDGKEWSAKRYIDEGTKLENAKPIHASPLEHCARSMSKEEFDQFLPEERPDKGWSGNFRGFIQYRKMIPNENITK